MIRLELPWPPSTNTLYPTGADGRRHRSAALTAYYRQVAECCLLQLVGTRRPLMTRLRISLWLSPPRDQRWDVDGRLKALQDALEKACVYANDQQIDEVHVYRCAPMAGGKVEVRIDEYEYE
jgi:Holliday junction resolvase RusA-like endonuclease